METSDLEVYPGDLVVVDGLHDPDLLATFANVEAEVENGNIAYEPWRLNYKISDRSAFKDQETRSQWREAIGSLDINALHAISVSGVGRDQFENRGSLFIISRHDSFQWHTDMNANTEELTPVIRILTNVHSKPTELDVATRWHTGIIMPTGELDTPPDDYVTLTIDPGQSYVMNSLIRQTHPTLRKGRPHRTPVSNFRAMLRQDIFLPRDIVESDNPEFVENGGVVVSLVNRQGDQRQITEVERVTSRAAA